MLMVVFRGRHMSKGQQLKPVCSPEGHSGGFQNSMALDDFVGRALDPYTGQEANPCRQKVRKNCHQ